jgi:hypothetical protein
MTLLLIKSKIKKTLIDNSCITTSLTHCARKGFVGDNTKATPELPSVGSESPEVSNAQKENFIQVWKEEDSRGCWLAYLFIYLFISRMGL